jgi:RHS repeat-associated protein
MSPSLAARTLLLMSDPHQTPLGERDSSSLKKIVHSPYGWSDPGLGAESRTGFNGQLREPPGWYQLGHGHRVYNPRLRRFHSADRLSPFDEGGLNPYTYSLGDPVNFTDPTGRFVDFGSFLKGAFYDKPGMNMALSVSLFIVNFGGAIFVPPAGVARMAALTGTIGSTLGVLGSGVQMGGLKESGVPLSFVGTVFSTAAAATRSVIGIRNLITKWPTIRKDFGARVMNLFIGGYKPPVRAPSVPASPVGSRFSVPPLSPQSPTPLTRSPWASSGTAGSPSGTSRSATLDRQSTIPASPGEVSARASEVREMTLESTSGRAGPRGYWEGEWYV